MGPRRRAFTLPAWIVSVLFCCLQCCYCKQGAGKAAATPLAPALFIFGDSLVDPGNNNYILSLAKANYGGNGIDFPEGTTGRFCNGRTVADIVSQTMGLPFIPAYLNPATHGAAILQGVNYASGAAGILDLTGYSYIQRITMWQQIYNFQNTTQELKQLLGPTAYASLVKNSLFAFVMGSNDYLNNYLTIGSPSPRQYTPQQFHVLVINTYRQQLITLMNLGARKFLLSNVGPLGCIPYRMTYQNTPTDQCFASDNALVSGFNTRLRGLVDEMNSKYPHTKFVLSDSYGVVEDFVRNPGLYGFTNKDVACCGIPVGRYHGLTPCLPNVPYCPDRRDYVFWDPYHPSDAANVIIGSRFFNGPLSDVYPMNIRALLSLKLP